MRRWVFAVTYLTGELTSRDHFREDICHANLRGPRGLRALQQDDIRYERYHTSYPPYLRGHRHRSVRNVHRCFPLEPSETGGYIFLETEKLEPAPLVVMF